MKRRLAMAVLRAGLARSPAAALLGPRQCGKTTLARSLSGRYFDVEQPAERVRLDLEWNALVAARELVVIDEAQSWPEIFPRLRAAIDADRRRNGRFLLLGSVSPALMGEVSESLAGRLALLELTPFLLSELGAAAIDRLWLAGGFPDGGILKISRFPAWQRDYLSLMAQRDLPAWGLPARPQVTERLLQMLAAVHAQPWNASTLGQSLGLSYHTVNSYADHLEAAYLIRRLQPWSGNLRKRVTRSPKMYLRDSGLLHALSRIESRDALLGNPLAGASWEGFIIEQVLGALAAHGMDANAHFLRTSDGYEIDLLLGIGRTTVAIEVKLSAEAEPRDLARLEHAADMVAAEHRYIVCRTRAPTVSGVRGVLDLPATIDRLRQLGRPRGRVRY